MFVAPNFIPVVLLDLVVRYMVMFPLHQFNHLGWSSSYIDGDMKYESGLNKGKLVNMHGNCGHPCLIIVFMSELDHLSRKNELFI